MKDNKFVVLCVDDDQDVLQNLRLVLEKNGYLALVASNTKEAGEVAQQSKPDLFIVDMMMEQIDSGTNLVAQLRQQGHQAPIYMLSAVGEELHKNIDTETLGLDGVFQKPIDSKSLLTVLRTRLKAR